MKIITHRGDWRHVSEQNSRMAVKQAFDAGFGSEIDIRDRGQELVVSHDMATEESVRFAEIVEFWNVDSEELLALDMKSCGLKWELQKFLKDRTNYFCFGMPLTEMLEYQELGIRFFTRQSEYETELLLYEQADGVWLDYFEKDDTMTADILEHVKNGKKVCVVSAELNGRSYEEQWRLLKTLPEEVLSELILCTDYAKKAALYFHQEGKTDEEL